ncbi:hypothetical protein BJX99DRAFT_251382 [Aspergillus californicus]
MQAPLDAPQSDAYPQPARTTTNFTVDTEYIHMHLELDNIHWAYNFLASFASWTLLAGYLVELNQSLQSGILSTVQNPPLVAIACTFLGVGAVTMLVLFYRWRHNYIWVTNRLFLPTCLNTCAGLLTTLINIYTSREGNWLIMALLTVIATRLSAITSLGLTGFYKFWKLKIVQQEHE